MIDSERYQCEGVRSSTLVALFLLVTLPLLWASPIGGSSEAREAQVAWRIVHDGAWLLPDRNGLVPSKPLLYHWSVALSALLGIPFSVGLCRAVSLLHAVGILALIVQLAIRVAQPLYPGRSSLIANLSVFILTTIYGFQALAGVAMVDMVFTFWVTAALAAVVRALLLATPNEERLNQRQLLLFWICAGVAVLAKGPLGVVLPLLLALSGTTLVCGWRCAIRSWLAPQWGWVLVIVIPGWWYLLAGSASGGSLLSRQILFENLARFFGGEQMNSEVWWFYLPQMLRTLLPWTPVVLMMLHVTTRVCWQNTTAAVLRLQRLKYLGAFWFVVGVLFFSIASGKRPTYLLPLYPTLALSVALFLVEPWGGVLERIRRSLGAASIARLWSAVLLLLALGLVVLGCLVLLLPEEQWIEPLRLTLFHYRSLWGVYLVAIALTTCVLAVSPQMRILRTWWFVLLLGTVLLHGGSAVKNSLRGFDAAARTVGELVASTQPLFAVRTVSDELLDPILFYLERQVMLIEPTNLQSIPVGAPFIAREAVLKRMSEQGITARVLKELRQPGDRLRHRSDRVLILAERTL